MPEARSSIIRPEGSSKPATTEGFIRLPEIIGPGGPIPVSRSSWWAGVKAGRFPQPIKLGPRTTAWRRSDIAALINAVSTASSNPGNAFGKPKHGEHGAAPPIPIQTEGAK